MPPASNTLVALSGDLKEYKIELDCQLERAIHELNSGVTLEAKMLAAMLIEELFKCVKEMKREMYQLKTNDGTRALDLLDQVTDPDRIFERIIETTRTEINALIYLSKAKASGILPPKA